MSHMPDVVTPPSVREPALGLDADESVRALRSFLASRGVYFCDSIVCTMDDGSYRGVKATRDIEKDAVLLSVPEPLLLSTRSAKRDADITRVIQQTRVEISDEQLLAIHLLREVSFGADSLWYPYIRTLPMTFETFLYLKDEDVEETLCFDHAIRDAWDAKSKLVDSYRSCSPVLKMLRVGRYGGLNAFRWAVSCIRSRTMFMPGDTVGCLMPLGDMHNHTPKLRPITLDLFQGQPGQQEQQEQQEQHDEDRHESHVAGEGYFDEENQRYVLVTRQRLSAGDQIFLTYGTLTNLQLLGRYGFTLDSNPYDTCMLPVACFPEPIQKHLPSQEACFLHFDGTPSFELMRAVRLGVLQYAQRKKWAYLILDDRPVEDHACEAKALEALYQAVAERRGSHETPQRRQGGPDRGPSGAAMARWRDGQLRIMDALLTKLRTDRA